MVRGDAGAGGSLLFRVSHAELWDGETWGQDGGRIESGRFNENSSKYSLT